MTKDQGINRVYAQKCAIVTGASSGIGRAFCEALAKGGADIILTARNEERLEQAASEIEAAYGVKTWCLKADLSIETEVRDLCDRIARLGVTPDILVNNAGYTIPEPLQATTYETQRGLAQTSMIAPLALIHFCLPHMLNNRWGRIINVSSIMAFVPGAAGHTLYPASKAFLLRLSQSLHEELRGTGVSVTALCPGTTQTSFREANQIESDPQAGLEVFTQSAVAVARAGLHAADKGHGVCVPGWHNKLAVGAIRVAPSGLIHFIARSMAPPSVSGITGRSHDHSV